MEADLQRFLSARSTHYRDVEPAVLAQLAEAAEKHGLEGKQAAAAFDKFMSVHRQSNTSVDAADVAAFRADYRAAGKSKLQPLAAARSNNFFNRVSLEEMVLPDAEQAEGDENAEAGANGGAAQPSQRITPYMSRVAARPASAAKPHTPTTGGKFAERQGAGSVLASLNPQLEVPAGGEGEAMEVDGQAAAALRRCEVTLLGEQASSSKYMVDRLEDKVAYLEGRILAAEAAVEAALGCEVHPVATAAQQAALFVGRVCCDTEGGRLNAQSLLLEGSQKTSQGGRVRLDVSRCPSYRLFPGQVLALLGTNPSGHCVVASRLLPGAGAAPQPATGIHQLAGYAAATGRSGLSLVAAAGPLTSSDDLEYAPLAALLEYCAVPPPGSQPPDVLLLAGPFVDEEHPLLREGLAEETFEDIYASRVLGQLSAFSKRVAGRTRVLLVPSTRDLHHHPVLPQPALEGGAAEAAGATPLPNPATLRCNEVVVGLGAADWLMACNREEVARSGAAEERLPALAAHLAAQRSYFPLFPPPLGTPLDCSRAGSALHMPMAPDLLLLPSDLAPFAKLCPLHQLDGAAAQAARAALAQGQAAAPDAATQQMQEAAAPSGSAVCVNPGRLTKGSSGGTFAHIHILPLPEALDVAAGAPAATNAPLPHQLAGRCRVDIRRV